MVQVHVPQGVGVRVPPWAPSTELVVQKSRRLLRVCGFFHFRAPACRWVVSRAPILVTQQLPPLTPRCGPSTEFFFRYSNALPAMFDIQFSSQTIKVWE